MPHVVKVFRLRRIAITLLCLAVSSSVAFPAPQSTEEELQFHADVPLGILGISLKPSGQTVYLMATAQNPEFEGMHQKLVGGHRVLFDAQDRPVEFYPRQITFRVTATAWPEKLLDVDMLQVETQTDVNSYLLGLRFRMTIFHGLRMTALQPASFALIGMPADVPYRERIYGLTFDVGQTPIDDRIVLEIFSPDGERLSKFHLDLY